MKLGVLTALYGSLPLDEMLDRVVQAGLEAVELGTGNYPGSAHCPVAELLKSQAACNEFKKKIVDRGLVISALSCHGNPLHPDAAISGAHHRAWRNTLKLAPRLGVDVVINFSGCPGDSDSAKHPNWVTCPWPDDYTQVVEWQWKKKVLPYWKREAKRARDQGIKVAFEMHPGFVVYNTETLLRLRAECGENVGANFDPSHLFWQGMDPIACLKQLGGEVVYHVHAKDCKLDLANIAVNGVLDTKHYALEAKRSWLFRTVGYGHGEEFWRDFVSTLRLIGYDGVLSIEHEDSLMSQSEGLTKAVAFLKSVLLSEKRGGMWWA
ncbi:MAG: sugar phosphate isomerase/epimerase [Planctomycetota bacterium]